MADASPELSARDHADATTSVPLPAAPPLRRHDAKLIAAWASSLGTGGYAASSIEGAAKRLETFARRLRDGLLRVTRRDVVAFYEDREALAQKRRAEQQSLGLRPARMVYLYHPTWANFVASAKDFYSWSEREGLLAPCRNPFEDIQEYRRASTDVTIQPEWYGEVLHSPLLTHRERPLLWLLAHGLTLAETLRLKPTDVKLKAAEVYVTGQRRTRTMPLSEQAAEKLTPWVTAKYLSCRPWLFPSRRGRHLSDRRLREIVQTVARRVFPHPGQADIRHHIRPMQGS